MDSTSLPSPGNTFLVFLNVKVFVPAKHEKEKDIFQVKMSQRILLPLPLWKSLPKYFPFSEVTLAQFCCAE